MAGKISLLDDNGYKVSFGTIAGSEDREYALPNSSIISKVASSTVQNMDSVSVSNTVVSNGFSTYLHTGNGTTQDILNGIDFISSSDYSGLTLWSAGTFNAGDEVKIVREGRTIRVVCLQDGVTSDPNTLYDFTDATFSDWQIDSQTNGGLAWIKERSSTSSHSLNDTLRGVGKELYSNATTVETANADALTSFNADGFSLGADAGVNQSTVTNVSWSYQTTHIKSSLTSHGKPQIEEYNPVSGFTMIKYKGSGLAGHEISHSMGRELGIIHFKRLDSTNDWTAQTSITGGGKVLQLNEVIASTPSSAFDSIPFNSNFINISSGVGINNNNSLHIMYGWANATKTEEGLQGNYEIDTYTGTGVAGNKVTTKGKPAYVMIKRLDDVGEWKTLDILRQGNSSNWLEYNTPDIEGLNSGVTLDEDGFTVNTTSSAYNTLSGQYLYKVIYDNDSGSGKSKYDKPTDTSILDCTDSIFNYTNGKDASGFKLSTETVSGIVDMTGVTDGMKWVARDTEGDYSFYDVKPMYTPDFSTLYTNRPLFIDGKWKYSSNKKDELLVGTDFNDGLIGNWVSSVGSPTVIVENNALKVTNTGSVFSQASQTVGGLTIGETYTFKCDLVGTSIGSGNIALVRVYDSTYSISEYSTVWLTTLGELSITFVAKEETHVFATVQIDTASAYCIFDNFSLQAESSYQTIGAEILPTPSFIKNPVMIENGIPQYIDYSQELATNVMDSLVVDKITTKNNRVVKEIGTIYANNRYVIPWIEVFVGYEGDYESYEVHLEIQVAGKWFRHEGYTSGSGTSTTYGGAKSFSTDDGIVVQTGESYIAFSPVNTIIIAYSTGVAITSAPARVVVTYLGKAKEI